MIPLGYMAKRVARPDGWLKAPHVTQVYSVSSHLAADFGDWINAWMHNGYWFFDSPAVVQEVALQIGADLAGTTLFYYEGFEMQYDEESHWGSYSPTPSFPLNVEPPARKTLRGFDVVTYSCNNSAECSPLSCNALADEIPVNEFCLLASLEEKLATP